jgi:hypothetical protein
MKATKNVVVMAYTQRETGDLVLELLNLEDIKKLYKEVFGEDVGNLKYPADIVELILEEWAENREIYEDFLVREI